MKFKIETTDFWLDEDADIDVSLKKYIINTVVEEIWAKINKKVDEHIVKVVKDMVEKTMFKKMNIEISRVIETGTIESDIYDYETGKTQRRKVSIEEYIKNKFVKDSGWSSPNENIKKLAEQFGESLRERYDLMFATQIVKSLDREGFLKEEIGKLLLKDNNTK